MTQVDWDKFSDGWASGSMKCRRCGRIFVGVRFRYSDHDKVEGNWPLCCGDLATFCDDWKPEKVHHQLSREELQLLEERIEMASEKIRRYLTNAQRSAGNGNIFCYIDGSYVFSRMIRECFGLGGDYSKHRYDYEWPAWPNEATEHWTGSSWEPIEDKQVASTAAASVKSWNHRKKR